MHIKHLPNIKTAFPSMIQCFVSTLYSLSNKNLDFASENKMKSNQYGALYTCTPITFATHAKMRFTNVTKLTKLFEQTIFEGKSLIRIFRHISRLYEKIDKKYSMIFFKIIFKT